MVIYSVPESDRALREQLRKKLAWFGFGSLAASVWVSPHDRTAQLVAEFADESSVQLDVFQSRSAGIEADQEIAGRAWCLPELDRDYGTLLGEYRERLDRYRAGEVRGRDALVERMRLVHDYRRFPFRDPDLPLELLPRDWRGRAAHDAFLEAHGLLRRAAEGYVDAVLDGTLEPDLSPVASS